jgi:DNA repair exonuclease SbcCD ATPase subunit
MILEQIILEGFLSYKTKQTVTFDSDGVYLVNGSINGDFHLSNGAGKSGLFEVIPVNFWGKIGGRSDKIDSYINDEMDAMYTEIIFKMDDVHYKSIMSKSRAGSANHEIFYEDNETWKKTDKTIDDILGLSNKSYSSTVYLSEREASQFIDGTGAERKEIFRELLNIQQFEEAANVCNKKCNDFDKKMTVNMSVVQNYKDDLDKEQQYKDELEKLKKTSDELVKEEKKYQDEFKIIDKKKHELQIQVEKLQAIRELISSENELLKENDRQFQKNLLKIKEVTEDERDKNELLILEKEQMKKLNDSKSDIEKQIREMKDQEKELIEIELRYKKLIDEISKKNEIINAQKIEQLGYIKKIERNQEIIKEKQERYAELIGEKEQVEKLDSSKKDIEKQIQEIREQEKEIAEIELKHKNLNDDVLKKNEVINTQKIEQSKIKAQIEQIDALIGKIDKFGNICPISEMQCKIINDEYRKTFKNDKELEKAKLDEILKTSQKEVKTIEDSIVKLSIRIEVYFAKIQSKNVLTKKIAQLEINLNDIINQQKNFNVKEALFNKFIETNEKAIKEYNEAKLDEILVIRQKETRVIEDEIARLNIQLDVHFEKIQSKGALTRKISQFEINLNNISNQQKNFQEHKELFNKLVETNAKAIRECNEENLKLNQMIEKCKEKIKELQLKINPKFDTELREIISQLDTLNADLTDIKKEIKLVENDISIYGEKLKRISDIKVQIENLIKENNILMRRKKSFQELNRIFGKDGIQKAIMKDSVPFLEKSACELLKIFNNDSEKLKIKFDLDPRVASGELRKGGGLDILVIEEGKEPKDLRMYSGGERVRSIFSVILGLSKLLSLRSGKRHDTMIIDEKIAKLDRKGTEQFVEIIDVVSKWYSKVFIITHIEALKEMLGEHEVLVNKTDEGSMVTVS